MGPTRKRDKFLPCIPWARGKRLDGSPEPAPRPQEPPLATEEAKAEEVTIGVAAQQAFSGLWKAVVDDLSKDDRQRLRAYGIVSDGDDLGALNFKDVWAQLIQVVEQKREDVAGRSWKVHFRGNTIVVRDVIGSIASRLQSVKDIGNVAADLVPQAALPWAIMKFLIQATVADQDQSGQLILAMETTTAVVARCQIYEILFCSESEALDESFPLGRLRVAVTKAYAEIMSTLLHIVKVYSMNTGKRTVYAFFNPGELSTKLGDLNRLEQAAEKEAANCERWESKRFRKHQSTHNQTMKDLTEDRLFKIQEVSSDSWEMLKSEEQSRILQWASPIRYLEDHHIAKRGIAESTGNWILRHEAYQRWRESEQSETLWLHGIPGAGKTKLSTRVVDAASSEATEGRGLVAVAHFYCDRNRADHQDPGQILASFVRQLSFREKTQGIVGFVHDEYRKHQAKGFAADMTFHERTELLGRLTSLYPKVFLVIDGLDECDRTTRRSFMDTLESVRISSTSTVKIFVASRDDGDIKTRYEATPNLLISASDNQEDIERFVLAQIDASTWRDDPKIQSVLDEVIHTFKTKSQGMFLWASLHIRDLLELQRPTDIRLYLKQLPEGLRKTYDQIFDKILAKKGSEGRIATKAFQWLMCSWRPLGPEELLVLACQDSDTDFSFETDITTQYLLEACHNLIVVTTTEMGIDNIERPEWAAAKWEPLPRSFCRFAHLSVQEYFESSHWNIERCNALATQACLRALATSSITNSRESWLRVDFDLDKYIQQYEEYPVSTARERSIHTSWDVITYLHGWHLHAASCGPLYHEVSGLIGTFVGRPYDASEAYKRWLHTMDRLFYLPYNNKQTPRIPGNLVLLKPVTIAALGCVASGLVELIECWIQEGILDVNTTTEQGVPLLSIAAEATQFQMCKLLLEAGADVNCMAVYEDKTPNGHSILRSNSPIDAAVQSYEGPEKRLAVTSLLIEHGAQANRSLKALECAVSLGDHATLKFLLDHGAGTNESSDGFYWWYALGHPELCTELFEHRVKTHEVILKPETFILGFKRDIRREGDMNANMWQKWLTGLPFPLTFQSFCLLTEALAWARSMEVMSVLIQHGADPSSALGMPIYEYGYHGFQSMQMESLMHIGCSIDTNLRSSTDGLTPLERFCYQYYRPTERFPANEYDHALSLLIDEGGAEINSNGPVYGTPLHICFTPRFGPFGCCLGWPDWGVNMPMAWQLLDRGARVNIRGGRDDVTVVELALQVRNVKYVDLVNGVLAAADLPTRTKEDFPDNRAEPPSETVGPDLDLGCPHRVHST